MLGVENNKRMRGGKARVRMLRQAARSSAYHMQKTRSVSQCRHGANEGNVRNNANSG